MSDTEDQIVLKDYWNLVSEVFAADSHVVGENPIDDDSDLSGFSINVGAGMRPAVRSQPKLNTCVTQHTAPKIGENCFVGFLSGVLVVHRQRKPQCGVVVPSHCIEIWKSSVETNVDGATYCEFTGS